MASYGSTGDGPLRGDYVLMLRGESWLSLDTTKYIASTDEFYVKFRYMCNAYALDVNKVLLVLYNTDGELGPYFRFTNTGVIQLVSHNVLTETGGTILETGSTVMSPDVWYLLEFYIKVADSPDGAYEVKVNGITDIVGSGVDTQYYSPGTIGSIRLHNSSGFNPGDVNTVFFDDFALDDAAWPGDGRIVAMVPNASGDENDWDHVNQGSDTSDWQAVDERPTDNVDYLYTNVINELHSLHLEAAPDDAMSVINGVQGCLDCRKTGIPNVLHVENMLTHSGWGTPNQLSGVDKELSSDENKTHCYCWPTNPGTAAAWAKADLANLQVGVKSKA
jgi:hypothetical protein